MPTESSLARFADAFNRRDLDAIRSTLASNAIARVVGAPFPEERGREAIASTSLPYLFDSDLAASLSEVEGSPALLLRTKQGAGPLDVLIEVTVESDGITRLDYFTGPHEADRLRAAAASLGLATTIES